MWNQWIDSVWYFNHKTTIPQSSQQLAGKNRWAVSRTLGTQQQVSPSKGNSLSYRNCNFRLGTYLPAFWQVGCSQREKTRDTCLHARLLLGCFWWALSSAILTHGNNSDVLQKRKLFQRRISNFCFWEVYWNAKHFWTELFDNYLLRAYYVWAISVNASQDRKENPYDKTIGPTSGAMAETQASEIRFHVVTLLLICCHTVLLYLNATLTSFHYLHCKHSRNSECAPDTLSVCWAYYQHKWQHYLEQCPVNS